MAKSPDDAGEPAAADPTVDSTTAHTEAARQPQPVQIKIDDSRAIASYANFCRVTGTPEELIIDFGLNTQPFGVPTEPIPISQRIIVNFYTAKRMLYALQMAVQRHEATFGAIEIDVQRRVRPGVMGQP